MTPQPTATTTTTTNVSTSPSRLRDIEAIDKLLFTGIVFFTLLLIAISKLSPSDVQTFQVISGLLTGFGGAFFARMSPKSKSTSHSVDVTPLPPTE
jgi:hypothetical protein